MAGWIFNVPGGIVVEFRPLLYDIDYGGRWFKHVSDVRDAQAALGFVFERGKFYAAGGGYEGQ